MKNKKIVKKKISKIFKKKLKINKKSSKNKKL